MSDVAQEQSMEDILQSIKRVMAREPAKPDGSARRRPRVDDVLELTPEDAEPAEEALISPGTARAAREKLESLNGLEPARRPGDPLTVEELVGQMLKPLLRDWLDQHLPDIVEAAVTREVRRITGG